MATTMTRFVVGVDGSAAAASAVRWAGRLAAASDAELVAVNAFLPRVSEVRPQFSERLMAERESVLPAWIAPAVEEGASVRAIVKQGDPRDVLLGQADEDDPDLIVIGRTGQSGGPGFLHLGSVVEHIAHQTRWPLAVIPSAVLGPIRRIVVGLDGSQESLTALDFSAQVARLTDASVVVVVVKDPGGLWSAWPDDWRQEVEGQIKGWVAPLATMEIAIDYVIQTDLHPADGLLGVASAAEGDVLVIGTRGAGPVSGVRMGGVAMKVLHRASLPLVLVPPTSAG